MAKWEKNNVACLDTYLALVTHDQLEGSFEDAGGVNMKLMKFWQEADDAAERDSTARALATKIDRLFTKFARAKYEDKVTRAKAVAAMHAVLKQGDKTVADLAVVNDENYNFHGEVKV